MNKLEISFKYVMKTLYGSIGCHTAKGSQKVVHAYTYVRHKIDVRYVEVWNALTCLTGTIQHKLDARCA